MLIGPFGGAYWMVVDPPTATAEGTFPGMTLDIDYGDLELVTANEATYRSEQGAVRALRRITGAASAVTPCPYPTKLP